MASTIENESSHIIEYDLHIHSTISDGTLTPYEIIDESVKKKLKGISITDHDDFNVNNIKEYALEKGLKYIYGIEFSTDINNLHIIAYNPDFSNPKLNEYINFQKEEREKALKSMCEKTIKHGIPVYFEELTRFNTRSLGRPHLAQIMMEKGYVANFYEAFHKYLKTDKPIYVDYKKYNYLKILDLILKSNGIPIFAHPGMIRENVFQSVIYNAVKNGLRGLEAYYPRHNKYQLEYLKSIAKKYNLVLTGGSDFHGIIKPDIKIGDAGISQKEFDALVKLF